MLAVIPAKGSSTRLPRKNLRALAGVPLFLHAVSYAVLEGLEPIVSTDDDEVFSICRQYDISCFREAVDESNLIQCLRQIAAAHTQERFFALLQPTSPFRSPGLLAAMRRRILCSPQSPLFTASPLKPIGQFAGGKTLCATRDQDCLEWYHPFDGNILVTSRELLEAHDVLLPPGSVPLDEPHPLCGMQVDTPEQWAIVEALCPAARRAGLFPLRAGLTVACVSNKRACSRSNATLVEAMDLIVRINGLDSLDSGATGSRTDIAVVLPGTEYHHRKPCELHYPQLRAAWRVIYARQDDPRPWADLAAAKAALPQNWSTSGPIGTRMTGRTTLCEAIHLMRRAFPTARLYGVGDLPTLTRAPEHLKTAAAEDADLQQLITTHQLNWIS